MDKKNLLQRINILKGMITIIQKLIALRKPVREIIVHHTATDAKNTHWQAIENGHKSRWNFKSAMGFYMGYQYLIEWDGSVHQSRLDTEEGAHTIGHNKKSIGICLTGNFEIEKPSVAQLRALEELLNEKVELYNIKKTNIHGHRDFANKACPGENLYSWLQGYKGQ